MWYCTDGAAMMQGQQDSVYAFLRHLWQEMCVWLLVVPMHANCHRNDLAIKATLSVGHGFADIVAETMQ